MSNISDGGNMRGQNVKGQPFKKITEASSGIAPHDDDPYDSSYNMLLYDIDDSILTIILVLAIQTILCFRFLKNNFDS